jgi:hypothetical protein
MEVKDVFAFEDGTVVFTGPIETHTKFIGPCNCEIVQDGDVKASGCLTALGKRLFACAKNKAALFLNCFCCFLTKYFKTATVELVNSGHSRGP